MSKAFGVQNPTHGESANSHPQTYHTILQAKALILQESWEELAKYIDEPGVAIGDLYYIDNLISVLGISGV